MFVQSEKAQESVCLLTGSQIIEETTDVLLEENDDGKGADTYQLVENTAQQLHLQYLADDNPATDEEQHAIEDVDGARLLHQLVAIEKHYRNKEDVDEVFEAYVGHLAINS